MDKEELARKYNESIEYDKKQLQDFWDNLSEQQKNDYINAVNQINGAIDWQAKARELILDPPSMGKFIEIFRENVLTHYPQTLERWDNLSTQDKVLCIITLFKRMDELQKTN